MTDIVTIRLKSQIKIIKLKIFKFILLSLSFLSLILN
jgi:hypothetical protein